MPTRTHDQGSPARLIEDRFILTFWTGDTRLARAADRAGIDRVGVDLEVLGKAERQGGLGVWISHHRMDQVPLIAEQLTQARLFARTNPVHDGSADEVERLLDAGVKVLMLPYFTSSREVAEFVRIVRGRAYVVPLLESALAAAEIQDILALDGIQEIHIGINDLGLSLGLRNRFMTFTTDLIVRLADSIRSAGKCLGIGHIGRALDDSLPIPTDLVYAQYARLGASAALIGQQFLFEDMTEAAFRTEVQKARDRLAYWFSRPPEELDAAHAKLCAVIKDLAAGGAKKASG